MFSLKAVERGMLLIWSTFNWRSGSVSDRLALFLTWCWWLMLCFRCVIEGDGRRAEGITAEGSLECDMDGIMGVGLRRRVGRGRLLSVRLLGMPPMGSSGKQT